MRGKINKIKGILALLLFIVLTSNSHLLMSVATDDNLPKEDVKAEVKLESKLEKYVSYELEGKKAKLVQIGIKTGIEFENEEKYVPLRATGIVVNAPEIDGMYPFSVDLIGKSTQSTNGSKIAKDFKLEYDKENGQVKLVTFNQENENGEIFTGNNKDLRDSFSLVLNYVGNDIEEDKEVEEKEINFKGVVIDLLANKEKTKFMQEFDGNVKVKNDISGLISTNVTVNPVYNGYIKSNKVNDTNYTTDFKELLEINISKANMSKEVKLDLATLLKNKNGENVNSDDILYKFLTLNKQEILNVLGEDGYFKIIDKEQNEILNLNKDVETKENGTFDVKFENEISNLTVVFSKPQTVGNINILINKQIKDSVKDISLNEIEDINLVKCVNYEEIKYTENDEEKIKEEEKQVYTYEDTYKTQIHDSEISIELNLNEQKWTNEKQNEVNFEIKLLNNCSKYDLFENPSFEIKLPNQVQKVILDNTSILYANGLEVKSTTYDENTKTIKVETTGKQTKYLPEEITDGTKIIVPATIILNSNIDNEDYNLSLNYKTNDVFTNEEKSGEIINTISLENFTQEIVPLNNSLRSSLRTMSRQQNITTQEAQQTRTLQTVEGIDLIVKPIKGDVELNNGDTVYEGEFIKYEITAKNTTGNDIDNVKIDAILPEGVTYAELVRDYNTMNVTSYYDFTKTFETIDLGTIKAGKTQTTYFEVRANDLQNEETQKDIVTTIKAYIGEGLSQENTISNTIKQAEYKVTLNSKIYKVNGYVYSLKVESEENEEVTVKVKLPSCMKFGAIWDSMGLNLIANKGSEDENNVVTARINTNQEYNVYTDFEIDNLDRSSGLNPIDISTVAIVNDKYISNEDRINIEYRDISISMTSPTEGEKINSGDEIDYQIKVTNTGKFNSDENYYYAAVVLKDILPEGVYGEQITYNNFNFNNETKEFTEEQITSKINNEFEIIVKVPYKQTVTVNVKAKAGVVSSETKVSNSVTVSENTLNMVINEQLVTVNASFAPKTSNEVSHIILPINEPINPDDPVNPDDPIDPTDPDDPVNPDDPDNPDEPDDSKKYNITGYAWNDKNGDGAKQKDEEVLKGIKVYLLKENGQLLRTTQTLDEGTYYFEEVEQGKYIVLFKYDNNKYQVTKYQASGISNDLNSNANKQTVTIQGEKIDAGVTDIINLNKDAEYINIGLVENKKFDFRIDNYITKVTVKTNNGTKEYNYNYTNLAKAEIKAKEIEGSSIEVEYKIIITNNGEINGTVNKIVDYLPEGLFYSDAQGTSWMRNIDGSLINTSLANKIIEPGKSEEITLIATKSLTEDSMGTLINKVKIESTSNELNVQETSKENNTSSCELIVSISTGLFVIVTIISIILIALLVFLNIKFNIFKKLPFRFLSIMIVIGISIFGYGMQYTRAETLNGETSFVYETKNLAMTMNTDYLYRNKRREKTGSGYIGNERWNMGSIYGMAGQYYNFNMNYYITYREVNGRRLLYQVHNYSRYPGEPDLEIYRLFARPYEDIVVPYGEDNEHRYYGLRQYGEWNPWAVIEYTGSDYGWQTIKRFISQNSDPNWPDWKIYNTDGTISNERVYVMAISNSASCQFIYMSGDARSFIQQGNVGNYYGMGQYLCINQGLPVVGNLIQNNSIITSSQHYSAWNGISNNLDSWGNIWNVAARYEARYNGSLFDLFVADRYGDAIDWIDGRDRIPGSSYNSDTGEFYSNYDNESHPYYDVGGIYTYQVDTDGNSNLYEVNTSAMGNYDDGPTAPIMTIEGENEKIENQVIKMTALDDNYYLISKANGQPLDISIDTTNWDVWRNGQNTLDITWDIPYTVEVVTQQNNRLTVNNGVTILGVDRTEINREDFKRGQIFYLKVNRSIIDQDQGISFINVSAETSYKWSYEGKIVGCLKYTAVDYGGVQDAINRYPQSFTVRKNGEERISASKKWVNILCGLRIEKYDEFNKYNRENVFYNDLSGIKFKVMQCSTSDYSGDMTRSNWLQFDEKGNVTGTTDFEHASAVTTNSQGITTPRTILGLNKYSNYWIYEIIPNTPQYENYYGTSRMGIYVKCRRIISMSL